MAAIITEKFRTHSAKQFIEDFGESASSTYMFIGRSFPWTDDTSPPSPANSTGEEYDAFSDMVALKKVSSADVSHAISRIESSNLFTVEQLLLILRLIRKIDQKWQRSSWEGCSIS